MWAIRRRGDEKYASKVKAWRSDKSFVLIIGTLSLTEKNESKVKTSCYSEAQNETAAKKKKKYRVKFQPLLSQVTK